MTRAILALLTAGAPAFGDGTATWLWDVTTQDGDAIVEPGETATISLSALMEVAPGGGPFVAFGAAMFDVIGRDAALEGTIMSWQVNEDLINLTGDLTTTDGVSLFDVTVGQLTNMGPFDFANPIDAVSFVWAPDRYVPATVQYATATDDDMIAVWEGESYFLAELADYPVAEASIVFTVVPAPAAVMLLAVSSPHRPRRK